MDKEISVMSDTDKNRDKVKLSSTAIQVAELSDAELTENVLLDCVDPVNKVVANKTEKYVNDKLNVDESWSVTRCCLYTTTVSGIMLFIGYLLTVVFELFIAVDDKLAQHQLTFLNYIVKALAVIAFILIVKAYTRMSDKALGYSGFIFAFSLLLLFSLINSFEKGFM